MEEKEGQKVSKGVRNRKKERVAMGGVEGVARGPHSSTMNPMHGSTLLFSEQEVWLQQSLGDALRSSDLDLT